MKGKVILVIPALNEEKTIGAVVKGAKKYASTVIVVDDASTDRTSDIAKKNGARVLSQRRNRGYDKSISDGFKLAKKLGADIIVTFDADGQHEPSDIPTITKPILNKQADVVVGIRPKIFRISEKLFRFYSKRKIGVSDPLCGLKAYRTDVYKSVGYFDRIGSVGTQLMFEAKRRGFRITERKIKLNLREDESRFGRKLKANLKILGAFIKIMLTGGV